MNPQPVARTSGEQLEPIRRSLQLALHEADGVSYRGVLITLLCSLGSISETETESSNPRKGDR